jgi:hypothetical protein
MKKTLAVSKGKESVKAELVTVDKKLVDEAAAWIRDKAMETAKKATVEVGEYIIKKFFDNDVEALKSKNPTKSASFRALAEKCGTADFPFSKTWLNNAVGVALMYRALPAEKAAFKELGPSVQALLLPLKIPEKVEKVADLALNDHLSFREVRKAVEKEQSRKAKDDRGRPRKPLIVKTLDRSLRLFAFEGGKRSFTKSDVDELEEAERKLAIQSAEALVEKLKALVGKLKSA